MLREFPWPRNPVRGICISRGLLGDSQNALKTLGTNESGHELTSKSIFERRTKDPIIEVFTLPAKYSQVLPVAEVTL